MFDYISFKLESFSRERFHKLLSEHVQVSTNTLTYVPTKTGMKQFVNWKNLRIEYFPNMKELRIKNSIHKFYNAQILNFGEFNHDDFTYNNFKEVSEYFCRVLVCKPNELKLFGRFEYGLNVKLNYSPFDIIKRFDSIVTTASNPFHVMPNEYGKPIEKRCDFTNYAVKFYDKGKQAQVKGKILRYEIVSKNIEQTRNLFNKERVTLQDLLNIENWQKCYNKLIKVFGIIRKTPFADNLSPLEYASIKAYTDPVFMEDHKKILNDKKKYDKIFAECKEVYHIVSQREGTCFVELEEKFKQAFEKLILEQEKMRNINIDFKLQISLI